MTPDPFSGWLAALETRHLANLRVAEVTRALRALSSAYVQRRHRIAAGAPLDSAGKRAAFALYYGPLHYLATRHVLAGLNAGAPPAFILDLGCGTGAAGAAWATTGGRAGAILGLDRHPWAADEARWTYRFFGLDGGARVGDLTRVPPLTPGSGVVAAYVLNELPAPQRAALETTLLNAGTSGVRVLVLEPVSRKVAPWWDATASRVSAAGGRADEWRFHVDLPPLVRLFDRAAGLRHEELTVRSLSMNVGSEKEPGRVERPGSGKPSSSN